MRYVALSTGALNQPVEDARRTAAACSDLQRPDWPPRAKYCGITMQGFMAIREGRDDEADRLLEQSVGYARACGSDILLRRSLGNMADRALRAGDVEKAVRLGRELMSNTPERHYHALVVRGNLANALLQSGEVAEAREVLASWAQLSRTLGWDSFPVFSLLLGLLAACEGRYEAAARLLGHAQRHAGESGGKPEANEQRAYDLAMEQVEKRVDTATRKRLMEEGASLDEEGVCALAFEPPPVTPPAAPPTPTPRRTPARETPAVPRR